MGRLGILWTKVNKHLQRALYLLGLASFTLPFVTVKGCGSEEITEYAGYELFAQRGGGLYLIPIGLGLLFLGLSFLRQHGDEVVRGFVSSMRTVLAFAAGYVVGVFPHLQFLPDLPDKVDARIGQYVATVSWSLVYAIGLASILISMKRTWPPKRATGFELKRRFIRLVFWLLVALALGLFGVSLAFTIVIEDSSKYFVLIVAVFALSLYLALHFVELGLNEQRKWAAIWVVLTAFFLLSAVVLALQEIVFLFPGIPVVATIIGVAGLAAAYFPAALVRRRVAPEEPAASETGEGGDRT